MNAIVRDLPLAQADQPTDLFPLFQNAARGARAADTAGRSVERDIHYATLEAIDEAAVDIEPLDIENALLRLGIGKYLLDRVYDHAYRGLSIDIEIKHIGDLISGAARAVAAVHSIDMRETALNFYLIDVEAP